MTEKTKSALPDHLVPVPVEVFTHPREEVLEFYRTQTTEGQYRDYLEGLNAAANPADGARQGRLA